jgi:predicted phage terminase large subunit-like protein
VKLVAGPWITDFLDELETFPEGAHDDQVDAASGAFQVLARTQTGAVRMRSL